MKQVGGIGPKKLLCDMEKADEINKVLDSIYKVTMFDNEIECENKLEQIKSIIESRHKTRSISEICKVIDGTSGGKPKPKSKSKTKKKNYKKKTKTRRKNKRKRNKRRKTYKKKK
jgi:hypothetical protein